MIQICPATAQLTPRLVDAVSVDQDTKGEQHTMAFSYAHSQVCELAVCIRGLTATNRNSQIIPMLQQKGQQAPVSKYPVCALPRVGCARRNI